MIASDVRAIALALVVSTSALALGAAPASGAPTKAEASAKRDAQAHLDRGNQLFTRDAYAEALAEFEAAYASFPSPKLHLNMGQCERALGHDAAAAEHFRRFLDEAPDVSPALRAEAERHLAEARAAVATAQTKPGEPPSPSVATTPAPPLTTPPAPSLAAPPKLVDAPAPQATPSRPLTRRWWFWTGVGVLVAGAGVSVFLLTRPQDPKCDASVHVCF